jgi:hypothetical protein
MKAWLRERPWIWIVLLLASFVVMDIVFVTIAFVNAPEVVG